MLPRRLLAKVAAGLAIGGAAALGWGSPSAGAVGEDEQFLAVLTNLDIHFEPASEGIAAGRAVCDQIAAGLAQHDDPTVTRAGIVEGLMDMWMDNSQAANMMWGAVDIYCPHYTDLVGD